MLHKRIFTVSIGDYGTIVALHNGKNIQNKILIASISDENKPQLESLFNQNKAAPIYIILDTTNQNYKKKTYPPVSQSDFHKIVKRDLNKEFSPIEKSFQSYYGIKDKTQNKWECTFVSAAHSPEIDKWIEFLLTVPNPLIGIYVLPVETGAMAKEVFEAIKAEQNIKTNENTVLSFVMQNKISGVRQVVFANNSIVFTRVVNYNFDDPQFAHLFEQDIFRANEYLKMIFPKLKAQDVVIINLLSDDILDKIKHIDNRELSFINYSPYQIAEKLNITNAVSSNSGNFSDIIIANCFANSTKKVLKFSNSKITMLDRLKLVLKSIFVIDAIAISIVLMILVKIILQQYQSKGKISEMISERTSLAQRLQSISNAALDDNVKKIDKNDPANDDLANEIIDFGKVDEVLSTVNVNISGFLNRLAVVKKYDVTVLSFGYSLPGYNPKAEEFASIHPEFKISGEISDKSGDIEILFKKFDALNLETKNKFTEYNVNYSEISKNIDFGKKYYSFPFDLTLKNKGQ
ncbi:conserved hypothetical protein [sediment metagenome]|uniref:Uncharacterized protein n=1 Tax=sediment metagenome TaxID=749907 RepID=D9PN45_9ZZZZ